MRERIELSLRGDSWCRLRGHYRKWFTHSITSSADTRESRRECRLV
jgi:hypothetical protein